MKRLLSYTLTCAALVLSLTTSASSANAGWATVPLINEAGGGGYWDNKSQDGSQKNVGYYLTSTGYFAGTGAGLNDLRFYN
jgi:hypothetical protein